jgi:4'-phosphopantetheinyl transferase
LNHDKKCWLESNAVYLCSLDQPNLESLIKQQQCLLDSVEQERALGFKRSVARRQYVVSRILLRRMLSMHLDVEAESLSFHTTEKGKPYLQGEGALQFSISHSHSQLALIVAPLHSVGIDIEFTRRKNQLMEIAKHHFTSFEYQQLQSVTNKRELFFKFWTLKEAYIKALGCGLTRGLSSFGFNLENEPAFWDEFEIAIKPTFYTCELPDNYRLAISILGEQLAPPNIYKIDIPIDDVRSTAVKITGIQRIE